MKARFTFPLLVSVALHAGLLLGLGGYEGPQVRFRPGAAAVTVRLNPSVASRPASPATEPEPAPEPPEPTSPEPAPKPPEKRPEGRQVMRPPPPPQPEPPPESEPVPTPESHRPTPPPPEPERPTEEPEPHEPANPGEQRAEGEPEPKQTAEPEPKRASGKPEGDPSEAEPDQREAPRKSEGPDETASRNSVDANAERREQGVTAPAATVETPHPEYPLYSRRYGHEGTVVVEVEVLASGEPGEVEVVKSSGHRRLDRAAVRELERAEYVPARRAGVPVTARKKFIIRFQLEDGGRR